MSIKKRKQTKFYPTEQDVKFKLSQLNITSIENKQCIRIHGVLKGVVGENAGEVDKAKATLSIVDILGDFSTQEKAAARAFFKACERGIGLKLTELKDETHDDSDVF